MRLKTDMITVFLELDVYLLCVYISRDNRYVWNIPSLWSNCCGVNSFHLPHASGDKRKIPSTNRPGTLREKVQYLDCPLSDKVNFKKVQILNSL